MSRHANFVNRVTLSGMTDESARVQGGLFLLYVGRGFVVAALCLGLVFSALLWLKRNRNCG